MTDDLNELDKILEKANSQKLLLTQQEWDDLAVMVAPFAHTSLLWNPQAVRRRALAERIIEANQ